MVCSKGLFGCAQCLAIESFGLGILSAPSVNSCDAAQTLSKLWTVRIGVLPSNSERFAELPFSLAWFPFSGAKLSDVIEYPRIDKALATKFVCRLEQRSLKVIFSFTKPSLKLKHHTRIVQDRDLQFVVRSCLC